MKQVDRFPYLKRVTGVNIFKRVIGSCKLCNHFVVGLETVPCRIVQLYCTDHTAHIICIESVPGVKTYFALVRRYSTMLSG